MTGLALRNYGPSDYSDSYIAQMDTEIQMPEYRREALDRQLTRGFTPDQTGVSLLGIGGLGEGSWGQICNNVILCNTATTSTYGVVFVTLCEFVAPSVDPDLGNQPLYEMRRLSGLSWEQIAEMLAVERRSVHNWTAGKPIALKNQQRIGELLSFLRYMDRGSAEKNATLLLGPAPDGQTLLQLVAKGDMINARAVVGVGTGRSDAKKVTPLAGETMIGQENFGRAFARGETLDDEGPITVLSTPKLKRVKFRKSPGS